MLWPACQSKPKQRQLVQKASQDRARAEYGDTDAQYRLGSAYYYGSGVPQDYAEAIRWFRKSAGQGSAKAQYALGFSYLYGQGVPRDLAEAIRWHRKAAEQGYPEAQCQLASLYYLGAGVPQDFAESLRWYGKCAAQGDPTGQRGLGFLYEHGKGVPRDSVEAIRWYRKAAEQGDRAAAAYLADAYRQGRGVPRNYVEAARWYLKIVVFCASGSTRRMGWTPFAVLLVAVGTLVVPERRWGRAKWLRWGLLCIAFAAYALHLVSSTVFVGMWRVFGIGVFSLLSAFSAFVTVYGAVQDKKRGVDSSQPPTA